MHESLWQAATALRDRLAPHEARDLMLTVLVVRQLGGQAGAPEACRWERLGSGQPQDLRRAVRALVDWQPALAQALPELAEVEPHRLAGVIEAVTALPHRPDHDVLGEAYMHLLGSFARAEGRRGGQYYTPPSVARLLAELVGPIAGTVYDPCCGSGGLLLQALRTTAGPVRLVGQEINPRTRALALLGAAVWGAQVDAGALAADTLLHDLHPDLRAEHVVANPPFNLARWGADRVRHDPRFQLGLAPDSNANLAWIQHIVRHLTPQGRGAVILANGALSSRSGGEKDLRSALLASGCIEGIVALPDLLFLTTPIPASVWLLGSGGHDRVLFVDARDLGRKVDRSLRVLEATEVEQMVTLLRQHRSGRDVHEPGRARSLERFQVDAEDLTPGRYVGASPADHGASSDLATLARTALDQLRAAQALDDELEPLLLALEDPSWPG